MMRSRYVALIFATLAAGIVLLALRPVSCYGDGPTGVGTVKVCKTAIGAEMEWGWDGELKEDGLGMHFTSEPSLTWGPPIILFAALAAAGAGLISYLAAEWRRDRLDSLLASKS